MALIRLPESSSAHWFGLAGALALALVLAACGGKAVDTTIPLDEARLLNSELSATYVRTATLLEQTSAKVDAIGVFPDGVPAASVDTDLLRHVLEACFTENVRMTRDADLDAVPRGSTTSVGPEHALLTRRPPVGRIESCNPSRMLALESYLPVVGEAQREYVIDRVLTVDVLRADLKDVLVAQIDDLERVTASSENELIRLRATAAERRSLAQSADMSPEARRQNEVDFEMITQELDQVEQAIGQIRSDIAEWRRFRRTLIDQAAANIARLGTP